MLLFSDNFIIKGKNGRRKKKFPNREWINEIL